MLSQDKGASSWLGAQPVQEHGFLLHKGAFHDALALWYGWQPPNLPSHCACGSAFDSTHALSCAKGGFTIAQHDEIRDLTASLMQKVCHDVEIEPKLQPLSGEQLDQAREFPIPMLGLILKQEVYGEVLLNVHFFLCTDL